MSQKKINSKLEKIVISEKQKLPQLGVRALAELIEEKYNQSISKSTVAKIIKEKGVKLKKGRKPARLSYEQKEVSDCGLILLSCVDSHIGLFDYLAKELNLYLRHLSQELVKKFIILASFSYFSGGGLEENIEKTGFLRLVGLKSFPAKKFEYFKQTINKNKPIVNLAAIKKEITYVSTVKIVFGDGNSGFCDAKMATFWDGVCSVSDFFLLKQAAQTQIERMLAHNLISIGYTQSFGNLSTLTINFIKSLASGIKKFQFLDKKGAVLSEFECGLSKTPYIIGYSPEVLKKGVKAFGRVEKERKLAWEELGEFYCKRLLCSFSQSSANKEVMLGNVRIRRSRNLAYTWGLLIPPGRTDIDDLTKNYLYRFPQIEATFRRDLKIIDKSLLESSREPQLIDIFPNKLRFRTLADFAWLSQLLSTAFKEVVGGWEPRGKKGNFAKGKTYLRVSLDKVPTKIRQKFNEATFYYEDKRVFLT